VKFIARQLGTSPDTFHAYAWEGRTIERHRALIRQQLGFREATRQDTDELTVWLVETKLSHQRKIDSLIEAIYERCRVLCLEPPSPGRIERLVRSAIEAANQHFFDTTIMRLSPTTRARLDALLSTDRIIAGSTEDAEETPMARSSLYELKRGAGPVKLDSLLAEIAKLQMINDLELPEDLFAQTSPRVLESYRQRIAVEGLGEVRRHPDRVRYPLLAAFCWQRRQEIIDTLVELLMSLTHRIGVRAEHKVDKAVFKELK
jgi:hypothetical protein